MIGTARITTKLGAPHLASEMSVSTTPKGRRNLLLTLAFAIVSTTSQAAPKTTLTVDCNAACDGTTLMTAAIQKAIDTAAPKGGTVSFKPGTYLTGALFLKSGVTFNIPEGVTLTGSQNLKDFPQLPTRIAGIEMTWPEIGRAHV